jgi:hypothetical protein
MEFYIGPSATNEVGKKLITFMPKPIRFTTGHISGEHTCKAWFLTKEFLPEFLKKQEHIN